MKSKALLVLFLFPILFGSCTVIDNWGIAAVVALFAIMIVLFGLMFFLIFKKRRQADKSLAKYTADLHSKLSKLDDPAKKIEALKIIIKRIDEDDKYKSDAEWKNKVLVKTYVPLAAAYYQTGEEMETMNICSKIIELDPEHGMSYYNRGSIYSNMGMYEKAIHDFAKAAELMPDYANTYNNRGLAHYNLEHYDAAVEDYSKAIDMEESVIVLFNRANAYTAMKQSDKALADYKLCLELDPSDRNELKKDIESVISYLDSQTE